jgi:trimethylguanosine synthase
MLFTPLKLLTDDIALFLPRTADLRQIAALCPGTNETSREQNEENDGEGKYKKIEVVHYCMYGASKGLCAYFGALVAGETPSKLRNAEDRMEE